MVALIALVVGALCSTSALAVPTDARASPASKRLLYNSNLTPDGYWHNRYHGLLSMAMYGDYNTTCPTFTFTKETELKNFPNATRPPWSVLGTFGPTPSGCQGITTIVPEMNKALIIFKGNYELEQQLPTDVISWEEAFNITSCKNCTVNAYAAKGYNECKAETNNWADIRQAYGGQGLVFSITGHGLGGMHALAASADLHNQNIDYYSHNYGTPRTFNTAGANWYNSNFNGEAGERGIYANDNYTEFIPAGPNYAHAGTPFFYTAPIDPDTGGPTVVICWDGNAQSGPITDDPACVASPQLPPYNTTTNVQDHYFYFTNVGQCGGVNSGNDTIDVNVINSFLSGPGAKWNASAASTKLPSQSGTAAGSTSTKGSSSGAGFLKAGTLTAGLVAVGLVSFLV
ncbi:hypothetical protein RQP46_006335 [Phenoliferia psychrophenolica]